jgi:hypothetical protein
MDKILTQDEINALFSTMSAEGVRARHILNTVWHAKRNGCPVG